jgi:phosphatidate cytidylyltransferase
MNPKLKERAQTALLFTVIMVAGIFIHRYSAMALILIISLGCTYEYSKITQENLIGKVLSFLTSITGFVLPFILDSADYFKIMILVGTVFVILAILNLYTEVRILAHRRFGPLISLVYTGLVLGLMAKYLFDVEEYKPLFLFSIFGLIWTSDSAAYLVGSKIGKTKLFERISPNKTWEGSLGAGFFALLLALFIYYVNHSLSLITWIIIAFAVWVFGTYGDLVESSLKREYKIKDSGTFMPGHGGFLDRFDSFLFIIPIVLLLLQYLN